MDSTILHETRLYHEHQELMKLNGKIIEIEPYHSPPWEKYQYYDKYRITFNIRTIISPTPEYRDSTICDLLIPPQYPLAPPRLICVSPPAPWHVNWYINGIWDIGCWNMENALAGYILRCARTLQFDPLVTNEHTPSNSNALAFWRENADNPLIIPCDRQILPSIDRDRPGIKTIEREKEGENAT